MKHTPTPWKIEGLEIIAIMDNDHIATIKSKYSVYYERQIGRKAKPLISDEANAAHIVKCVNAWDDAELLEQRLIELREGYPATYENQHQGY